MASTLKDENRIYTDLIWPPFWLRACIIASPFPASPAAPPPVLSGTRQHKTRNPRSSSRGCVWISDILKAVSRAWIRAGCCTACTHSVPKGGKEKEKRWKGQDAPSSAGCLEFLPAAERNWISIMYRRWLREAECDGRGGSWDANKRGESVKGREGHKSCSLPQVFLVCGKRLTFKLHKTCYDMQRN